MLLVVYCHIKNHTKCRYIAYFCRITFLFLLIGWAQLYSQMIVEIDEPQNVFAHLAVFDAIYELGPEFSTWLW